MAASAGAGSGADGSAGRDAKPNAVQRVLAAVDRYQRTHAWLGFPHAVIKKFSDDQAGNLAALVAYYAFFSLFPLLLLLVTILGYALTGNPDLQHRILHSVLAELPVIGNEIRRNVRGLSGSGVALAVGLGGLLWAGLGAIRAAENAMNTVWNVPKRKRPGFLASTARALLMLVVLGGGIAFTTVAAGIGTFSGDVGPVVRIAATVPSLAVNVGFFLVAFRVLTAVEVRWGDLVPGAVVAGVAWVVLQAVGGYYVEHVLRGASETYGTFGLVLALLSWLYLQAQVTLFAAEVNVVRTRRLWPRAITGDDLTEADRRALHQYAKVEERRPEQDVRVDLPTQGSGRTDATAKAGRHPT